MSPSSPSSQKPSARTAEQKAATSRDSSDTRSQQACILAIESSCDETAAAVISLDGSLRSSIVASQHDVHGPYGGVVPELAARRHIETIDSVVQRALGEASCGWDDLCAVAATQGPGLAGALLVGMSYAKACAYAQGLPLVLVNHLQGHVASAWMAAPDFPRDAVVLVVSGGHTHLYRVEPEAPYRLLGRTMDDAAGEAFDKGAKLLELGYPGGPRIDRVARDGRRNAVRFPRSMGRRGSLDFSFSGLKTSLLYYLRDHPEWREGTRLADIAAGYQEAIVDVLVAKALAAVRREGVGALAVVGGVSANTRLRARLTEAASAEGLQLSLPPLAFCTDNAAMIAAAGLVAYRAGAFAPLEVESSADLPIATMARTLSSPSSTVAPRPR